ncbi:peptide deformylase [Rubrobacter aplysinae]|uniref:peptide deformylase n=1 Tax=Rubrobacter aplysinae TaxID=909625 RepID=UPI00064BF3A6|nr:peptide deformylase [Rubrobacter aplysinae]
MALEIRTFGDPVLRSAATPVEGFDEALSRLAEDMLVSMREHEGVGLAATQVGRLKRIFVAGLEDEEYAVVNPVIESRSQETETDTEGCLSLPGVQVEVERPVSIIVTGYDPSGEMIRIEATELLARIIQHEMDHLDGITILERTDRESRREAMRGLRERMLAQR